jgi:hypothetical protein
MTIRIALPVMVLPVMALALSLAACTTPGKPETELTQEQVCLSHFENDPAERDRCMVDASLRHDSPPEALPEQLPLRTGQISD